jgi:ABC-2 type transport system permease protein
MTGPLAYVWLEARRQWRNREALIFRLGLPTAAYLILTATGRSDQSVTLSSDLRTLPSGTARMLSLAALGALISGLAAGPALGEERTNGWLRQLRATPLPPIAAVAAKIVVAMSFALPAIALVVAAAGVTDGTGGLDWAGCVELIGLMWLATAPITALGTLIGLSLGTEAAQGASTLAFLVLWLLGGVFTSPSEMPDALAAVARVLPSYGVVQVGWSAASGEAIAVSAVALLTAWTVGAGALAALAWRRVVCR